MPVDINALIPGVHQPWAEWSETETLHVAAAYSNPFRWHTRRDLANNFRRHLEKSPERKIAHGASWRMGGVRLK